MVGVLRSRIMSSSILLAEKLGQSLLARGEWLALAESCTGGWVAQAITAVAGSSAWFDRGFVTYSNRAKQEMLQVPEATLVRFGAVSEQTARAMALGALANAHADWAIAVTGIAGPTGGSVDKPVGTVCFAWAGPGEACVVQTCHFSGDRTAIREQSMLHALTGLLRQLEDSPPTA